MSNGLSVTALTPAAPPETVLRLAHWVARRATPFGALEKGDYISAACLAFYRVTARWAGAGCFGRYVLRCMDGAVRELRRQEARHHEGYSRRTAASPKAVSTPPQAACADGGSASHYPTSTTRYRRPGSRREHNRTYYYHTHERHHCCECGVLIERGHGARRCVGCAAQREAHLLAARNAKRARQPCACGCGTLVLNKWAKGHNNPRGWPQQREMVAA